MARACSKPLTLALLVVVAGSIACRASGENPGNVGASAQGTPADHLDSGMSTKLVKELPADVEVENSAVLDEKATAVEQKSAEKSDDSYLGEQTALLRVRLIAKEDDTPISGGRAFLTPAEQESWSATAASNFHARVGESAETNGEGLCELEAETGREYRLHVWLVDQSFPARAVPLLAGGEEREILVVIPTQLDLDFFGMVVDDATDEPIDGATVRGEQDRSDVDVRTQADGRFRVRAASWKTGYASVEAADHTRSIFRLGREHETEARALVVRLRRNAILEVFVSDASGAAIPAAEVTAESKVYYLMQNESLLDFFDGGDLSWMGESDTNGWCRLEGLPARVPVTLTVSRSGSLAYQSSAPLKLEPGETRRLEVMVGGGLDAMVEGGARIMGSLVDSTGAEIADQEIWCLAARNGTPCLVGRSQEDEVCARATTDHTGRFVLEDIAVGTWWVAPAPGNWQAPSSNSNAVPSLAQEVVVEPSSQAIDVLLCVERGLFLRGIVVDPSGNPASGASINATSKDPRWCWTYANANRDGTFAIGPLPAGTWKLTASSHRKHADSASIEAFAGESGLILQLRQGGEVRGYVIEGSTDEKRSAEIHCERTDDDDPSSWSWTGTNDAGDFDLGALAPGIYTISAKTRDGQFGFQAGISVEPGRAIENLRIAACPGGSLLLRFDGPGEKARCDVFANGVHVFFDGIARGETSEIGVPAEMISVVIKDVGTQREETKQVSVSPGSTVELAFGKAP